MNGWTRSKRLKKIASYIPAHLRVADIGADHAFLLIHLAQSGLLKQGIIGEINQGPYENARSNVKQMGLQKLIDVRLGDGLSVLQPDEIDVVVLAGMGGTLITHILAEGIDKLSSTTKLILQPNIGSNGLRMWLDHNGWQLTEEALVDDEGIIYEILVVSSGQNPGLYQDENLTTDTLYEIGPWLWRQQHPLLSRKLQLDLARKQQIIAQLGHGKSVHAKQKRELEVRKAAELERVIRCL